MCCMRILSISRTTSFCIRPNSTITASNNRKSGDQQQRSKATEFTVIELLLPVQTCNELHQQSQPGDVSTAACPGAAGCLRPGTASQSPAPAHVPPADGASQADSVNSVYGKLWHIGEYPYVSAWKCLTSYPPGKSPRLPSPVRQTVTCCPVPMQRQQKPNGHDVARACMRRPGRWRTHPRSHSTAVPSEGATAPRAASCAAWPACSGSGGSCAPAACIAGSRSELHSGSALAALQQEGQPQPHLRERISTSRWQPCHGKGIHISSTDLAITGGIPRS